MKQKGMAKISVTLLLSPYNLSSSQMKEETTQTFKFYFCMGAGCDQTVHVQRDTPFDIMIGDKKSSWSILSS